MNDFYKPEFEKFIESIFKYGSWLTDKDVMTLEENEFLEALDEFAELLQRMDLV